MAGINERVIEAQKEHAVKVYDYIRWIVLLGAGAFSLSFKVLIDGNFESEMLKLTVKLALTSNALGLMAGVIAVAGHAKALDFYKSALEETQYHMRVDNYLNDYAAIVQPKWLKPVQLICFFFLLASMNIWVVYVWLV